MTIYSVDAITIWNLFRCFSPPSFASLRDGTVSGEARRGSVRRVNWFWVRNDKSVQRPKTHREVLFRKRMSTVAQVLFQQFREPTEQRPSNKRIKFAVHYCNYAKLPGVPIALGNPSAPTFPLFPAHREVFNNLSFRRVSVSGQARTISFFISHFRSRTQPPKSWCEPFAKRWIK